MRLLTSAMLAVLLPMASSACSRDLRPPPGQPQSPLLDRLQQPLPNPPVKPTALQPQPPTLGPGTGSALLVLRDGREFAGTATLSGRLTVAPGRIGIVGDSKESLEVLYRLPAGLPAPAAFDGRGQVTLEERSTAGSNDRRLLVRANNRLLLAQVSLGSSQPIRVDLGPGLRLAQSGGGKRAARAAAVPLVLEAADAPLRVGMVTQTKTREGLFSVMAEASHWAAASSNSPGLGTYLLDAWVVGVAGR